MTDPAPPEPTPHDIVPTVRDRRIVWTTAASVLLHVVVIGWLLFPALREAAEAAPPAAIAVELVPEPASSSEAPSASASEAPSSEMPSSIEASSSEAAVSGESSAEQVSSSEAASSEPASHEPSSAASSEAASSEAGAASEPPSSAEASSQQPVTPMQRPVVIPVGPSEASSEPDSSMADTSASASASEEPSTAEASSAEASSEAASSPSEAVLTADTPNASEGIAEESSALSESSEEVAALAPPPPADSMLHAAKRYYLDAMLNSPNLAKARDALKKLPPERRLVQTCNIEALGQIGNAGHNYEPNALKADAFAKTVISGTTFTVTNGAFRSGAKWYALAYKCTLAKDLSAVESFSFHIGDEVTDVLLPKLGSN
jgi:uncharacterized protein DUF930